MPAGSGAWHAFDGLGAHLEGAADGLTTWMPQEWSMTWLTTVML
jgi:hypothetical protein